MGKIICIGSACKDIFFPTSEGKVLETPEDLLCQEKIVFELGAKYKIEERFEALGGCAANVAVGLVKLGLEAGCYSKLGGDVAGKWIKETLEKDGVGTELVKTENNFPSDLSAIVVDATSGDRVIFSNQKVNETLEIIPEEIKNAEWFFVGDLQGDWENKLEKVFAVAKENNIRVASNPRQINIHDNPQKVLEFISKSEALFINKDETIEVLSATGEKYSPEELENELFLIKKLKNLGPKVVALTDGKRGAWATDGEKVIHAPALTTDAKDTTGAGDAFCSGFLSAYIKSKNLEECLIWGIANGASSVDFYGGTEGLLNEVDIIKMVGDVKVEEII
jgi:sugar/nucleoside kinase (ribokinase family)